MRCSGQEGAAGSVRSERFLKGGSGLSRRSRRWTVGWGVYKSAEREH